MKNKIKYLAGFIMMVLFVGVFSVNKTEISYASYPEYPNDIKVTPDKFVPRIGKDSTFTIENYQFENTTTGIRNEHLLSVRLYTKDNPAQIIKEIKYPKYTIEEFKDGEWLNHGYKGYVNLRSKSYTTSGGLGTHIKRVAYLPGQESSFDLTNEEILNGVNTFNQSHGEDLELEDMTQLLFIFERLKENGEEAVTERDNRVTQEGPMKVTYEITDKPSTVPYATFQGYNTYRVGDEYVDNTLPMNWLYYENSDIFLEVVDPKIGYDPGDTVKLKIKIKNTSDNITNTRFVPGLDFGKKEIVKNPEFTEGTPDINFDFPEELGSKEYITKKLAPKEELEFETEITLPEDITNYVNESGDSIVLTPFLYTSNIHKDSSGQKYYLHYEEREYNEGIELKLSNPIDNKKDITLVGGPGTLTNKVEEQLAAFNQKRFSGDNRYATAVEISKTYEKSDVVVMASGVKYTDELTATVLANKLNAPILLTRANDLPEVNIAELERLEAKEVILIGGELTISSKVEKELLTKYGRDNVSRIGGPSRYETSILVGEEIRKITGSGTEAILVDGTNFPDAIAMTSMAVEKDMPILLTAPQSLHVATNKAIKDWNINNITIGGGIGSISTQVETYLKTQVGAVERIAGQNRYETATLVADKIYPNPEHVVIASGEIYPDAIVAAPYAASKEYPLLISRSNDVPEVVMNYINK